MNISNMIYVTEAIKMKHDYANLRIGHGKGKRTNTPTPGPQASGMKRTSSGNTTTQLNGGINGDQTDPSRYNTVVFGQ